MKSAQNTVHGDDFEGSAVWKKQTKTSKNASKKSSKKHRKMVKIQVKNVKNTWTTKKCIKNRLGEPTLRPEGGFGSIFGSLGEPKNRHFERKFEEEKKGRKNSGEGARPRRDTRRVVGKDMDGKLVGNGQGSSTPSLILKDGRADCLRFASPAEALGGWRLWGLKALRFEQVVFIDWFVGWLIVCLANVT